MPTLKIPGFPSVHRPSLPSTNWRCLCSVFLAKGAYYVRSLISRCRCRLIRVVVSQSGPWYSKSCRDISAHSIHPGDSPSRRFGDFGRAFGLRNRGVSVTIRTRANLVSCIGRGPPLSGGARSRTCRRCGGWNTFTQYPLEATYAVTIGASHADVHHFLNWAIFTSSGRFLTQFRCSNCLRARRTLFI